jgi:hypothetical protein
MDEEIKNMDSDIYSKKPISKELTEKFRIAIFGDNPNMNSHDVDAAARFKNFMNQL